MSELIKKKVIIIEVWSELFQKWLRTENKKEQTGYFFSAEELKKVITDAYDAGSDINTFYTEYIKQLNL